MKILITGSSGLVGSALTSCLRNSGHQVTRLVRSAEALGTADLYWEPANGVLNLEILEEFDAIIHLAGDNLADGRWTDCKKARIRASRLVSTRLLCDTLTSLAHPPRVLASASAVGFYGDRAAEILTEESSAGIGFLAEVCQDWEAATAPAAQKGIRVVLMRFGVVLSAQGGALAKMLLPFKLGLGGRIGHGEQYWSWIALDDVVGAIVHALGNEQLSGPVNFVSPQPVTNREFTETLGNVLARPTFCAVPAFAARLALGEMADAALLASTRVQPMKLLAAGYQYRHPQLAEALRQTLAARSNL
jgi:uncharacterized protein (TIGR01777 family)